MMTQAKAFAAGTAFMQKLPKNTQGFRGGMWPNGYPISKRTKFYFLHQATVDVKISQPVVLRAEGTWAIDLTWLKEVDVDSLTTVEKDSQVVLTVINCFSKYAWAKILPDKQAKTVSDAFRKILAGQKCSVIRSDNGSEFKSGEFEAVTSEFGIKPFSPTRTTRGRTQ
jgi:hypothetical protein